MNATLLKNLILGVIGYVLFFAFALAWTIGGVRNLRRNWDELSDFQQHGVLTEATIVRVENKFRKMGYGADVAYQYEIPAPDGGTWIEHSGGYTWWQFGGPLHPGDTIRIWYDPASPARTRVAEDDQLWEEISFTAPGVLMLILLIAPWVVLVWLKVLTLRESLRARDEARQ